MICQICKMSKWSYRNDNEEYLQQHRENYYKQYNYKIKENNKSAIKIPLSTINERYKTILGKKQYKFDSDFFNVNYLMRRLSQNPIQED